MAFIIVKLTRIIDSSFPAIGEFEFVDVSGKVIVVHEKFPVLGIETSMTESTLPIEVKMACCVISRTDIGILIDIEKPHSIADVHDRTRFHVKADRLIE